MHTLTLFGETPDGKTATAGVIKELAEDCQLHYEKVLDSDEATGWEGPLLKAPEGIYHLWQASDWCMLIITPEKMVIDGRLVKTKRKLGGIENSHLEAFRSLLAHSDKVIYVYEEPGTGNRQYIFLWPEAVAPDQHPNFPQCKKLGQVDLESGRIV